MGAYGAFKAVVRARVEKYGKEKLRVELLKSPVTPPSQVITGKLISLDKNTEMATILSHFKMSEERVEKGQEIFETKERKEPTQSTDT